MRWYRLRWPREVTPEQLTTAVRLLVDGGGQPLVIESVGYAAAVEHRLGLPAGQADAVANQLVSAIAGLALEPTRVRPVLRIDHALELRTSTRQRALASNDVSGLSRALLSALAHVRRGERLSLQWLLGRSVGASAVPSQVSEWANESWWRALTTAPFRAPRPMDAEARTALRQKLAEPGRRASLRLGVSAKTAARERQLIRQLFDALRGAEAPGVRFNLRPIDAARLVVPRPPLRGALPLSLNAVEIAAVAAWPVGVTSELPVSRSGSRLLAPSPAIARRGRLLGRANAPGKERPLALTASDSLRHLHVLGPTGSGKSTLLLNLIVQDMAAQRAVVVIEPKGDLIADVLGRVPSDRRDDVVLLDPSDDARPVGLNPLALNGRSPELTADQLLWLFHSLYLANWGPRTHDILGASLLTLARTPGMSLAALPLLLSDAGFRRRVLSQVADPIGLGPFWAGFEAWSEAERAAATAPVMNKLRPLLLRPELRAAICQPRGFDLRRVLIERKILLVNLNKGLLGPESAALLGSLVVSQLWQTVLGRSALAPERRHPVFVYVDEFQDYLHLPLDLADALAQSRSLGIAFSLAHQYLHQLDPAMRSAVLANAQTRVAFRLPSEDARLLAQDGAGLRAEDFSSLGAFEAYAQLVAGGSVQPWCSLRSLPPGAAVSDPASVRRASRENYGTPRTEIDAALRALLGPAEAAGQDLQPRRRGSHS